MTGKPPKIPFFSGERIRELEKEDREREKGGREEEVKEEEGRRAKLMHEAARDFEGSPQTWEQCCRRKLAVCPASRLHFWRALGFPQTKLSRGIPERNFESESRGLSKHRVQGTRGLPAELSRKIRDTQMGEI